MQELIDRLIQPTRLVVSLSEKEIAEPSELQSIEVHHEIGDAVTQACLREGLSIRGAYAFGEWLAELVTGWATRYSNEADILELDTVFGIAAFGDRNRLSAATSLRTLKPCLRTCLKSIVAFWQCLNMRKGCRFRLHRFADHRLMMLKTFGGKRNDKPTNLLVGSELSQQNMRTNLLNGVQSNRIPLS